MNQSDLNEMPTVKFEKTHPDAQLPVRAHDTDVGYDVFAVQDTVIPAQGSNVVPVGIKVADIPTGYWFKVESRSGLGFKHGIFAHPGIIDTGYRGDCAIKLYNLSKDKEVVVKKGDRCAQFVFYYSLDVKMAWGATVSSDRGAAGFGSTGK